MTPRIEINCKYCGGKKMLTAGKLKPTGNFCNTSCSNRFYGRGYDMKGRAPWNKGKTGVYTPENLVLRSRIMKQAHKPIPRPSGKNHPNYGRKLTPQQKAVALKNIAPHHFKGGTDHPWWNGGGSIDKHNGDEYKAWRRQVFERDDYRCFDCGQRGGKLHAHHWFAWARYKRVRFALDNGITLCEACHKLKHRKVYRVESQFEWDHGLTEEQRARHYTPGFMIPK